MTRHIFTGSDDLIPIGEQRAARRARIAEMMQRVAKQSEAHLPEDERRQVIDCAPFAAARRERQLRVAAVVAGLPIALLAAFLLARLITVLADAVGAAFLSH